MQKIMRTGDYRILSYLIIFNRAERGRLIHISSDETVSSDSSSTGMDVLCFSKAP